MVKVNTDVYGRPLQCEIYLDGYVHQTLNDLQRFIDKNWDGIGFIIGYEGDGKSVFAQQIAYYLDATFSLNKIVFNAEQFEEVVEKCKPGECIVWDEADELGSNWASKMMVALKRKMKRIRSKRLKILLVTPTIFDLNKYFVIHRTRFLFHVYAKGLERGFLRFFNRDTKKKLYLNGKKEWNMTVAKPNFIGRFTDLPKNFPIDQVAYNAKKDEATAEMAEILSPRAQEKEWVLGVLERMTKYFEQKQYKVTQAEYGFMLNKPQTTISDYMKEIS